MSYDRDLRREALNVLRLFFQEALRDEQRKVRVARAGLLDALVELVAERLPNRKTVRAEHDASAHRRIIRELRAQADVVVPRSKVLAARGYFFVVLFLRHRLAGRLSLSSMLLMIQSPSPKVNDR